jgi:putative Mn2+ efflux pump MntP
MSPEIFKSVLATVLLALALLQALGMMQVRGHVRLLPVEGRKLRQYHRWGGIAALALALTLAAIGVFGFGVDLVSSFRVKLHVALGVLAIAVLLLKVAISRRFRHYLRFSTYLGVAATLLILGTFVASALWYFVQKL